MGAAVVAVEAAVAEKVEEAEKDVAEEEQPVEEAKER